MSKESWQTIHARGQQTLAVWANFNLNLKVGPHALADH